MSDSAPPPPPRTCASCLYDLTGVTSPTCPECGYTPTPEAVRGTVFCELTRGRQWASYFWVLLPFAILWTDRNDRAAGVVCGLFAAFSLMWSDVAGQLFIKDIPASQFRIVRRAWRMNILWLQLPLALTGYAIILVRFMESQFGIGWRYFRFIPRDQLLIHAAAAGALAGLALAWPVWKFSMRRTLRIAAAAGQLRHLSRYTTAGRWAMFPSASIVSLPAVTLTILWLLDTLAPFWWR